MTENGRNTEEYENTSLKFSISAPFFYCYLKYLHIIYCDLTADTAQPDRFVTLSVTRNID